MQNYGKWLGAGAIVVASLTTVAGCADRNKNGQPDDVATSGEVANVANTAAAKTENTVSNAGESVSNMANAAGSKMENAGDALATTPKVKTALGANASLKGSNINVTTKNNQVMLEGSVKNAAQKTLAGNIAMKNGNGYKVVNNLKISGTTSPKM